MKIRGKVFVITLVATAALLGTAACSKGEAGQDADRGPHGGKLLTRDDFALEVQIFEQGIPPEYRLYAFDNGEPVNVSEFDATIILKRIDRTDTINFAPRADYLLGDMEVVEPHSFDVTVRATYNSEPYEWTYPSYEGRTEIQPEELRNAGVVIERAGPARMKNVIELPGQIALNADNTAHVIPQLSGVVAEVRKNLGDRVSRGEVIAVVNSGPLADAKEAFIEAVHHLELARITAAREEMLWRKKISAEEEYLDAKHALEKAQITRQASGQRLAALGVSPGEIQGLAAGRQGNLGRFELRAPLTGVVIGKDVTAGEAVEGPETIFTIADLSTVWADITISQSQLSAVREGQQVVVHSDAMNHEVAGTITYIGSLIGEESRSARARVVIPNPNGVWRPGLFINVHLTQSETVVPVAVKAEALQTFRDWDVVFIKAGNLFEAKPLELGRREGEWVEVISGLTPGTEYAAKNSFIVKADVMKSGASHDH